MVLLFCCRLQLLEFTGKLFFQLLCCLWKQSKTVCWETSACGDKVHLQLNFIQKH